jgi:predicted NBD/HSP70 family sugar kinase
VRNPEVADAALTPAHRVLTREVLTQGPLSRSELARRLGLSRASLTRLTKPLLAEGLFVEGATQREERTGRPVRPLDVAAAHRHFIGVNVTGDGLTAVRTSLRAEVAASVHRPLHGPHPEAVVADICDAVASLADGIDQVLGLGVSLGGHVRDHVVVSRAVFLDWEPDVPLAVRLEERTGLPTSVDNDLLSLTRAQHWFGAGSDHTHFAVLTIGAGVGYGLVVHDRVVESDDAGIGLVGHHPLDPLGPVCGDGHHGCAQMLTIPMICARTAVALGRPVTYDEFLALAAAGQPAAWAIAAEAGTALGRLVAAVANVGMAHRIILTGEGVGLVPLVRAQLAEGIRRDRDPLAAEVDLDVQPSDFTEWARGAAVMAIQRHVLGAA